MHFPSLSGIWHEMLTLTTRARAQIHAANKIGAMNDLRCEGGQRPSWFTNSDRLEEFLSGLNELLLSRDVPSGYVGHVLGDECNYRRLINYTGALEARKATFAEQQMAGADLILEWWLSHVRVEQLTAMLAYYGIVEMETSP